MNGFELPEFMSALLDGLVNISFYKSWTVRGIIRKCAPCHGAAVVSGNCLGRDQPVVL